jgi:hypothetical protein
MWLIFKYVQNTLKTIEYVKILQNTKSEFTKYDYRSWSRTGKYNREVQQYGSQNPVFPGRAVAKPCEAAPTISGRIKD